MATERKMETDGFEKRVGLPHITHVVCTRGVLYKLYDCFEKSRRNRLSVPFRFLDHPDVVFLVT